VSRRPQTDPASRPGWQRLGQTAGASGAQGPARLPYAACGPRALGGCWAGKKKSISSVDVERLGVLAFPLILIRCGQVVEGGDHTWVVRPQGIFPNGQS